jgi:hypothetical protein
MLHLLSAAFPEASLLPNIFFVSLIILVCRHLSLKGLPPPTVLTHLTLHVLPFLLSSVSHSSVAAADITIPSYYD